MVAFVWSVVFLLIGSVSISHALAAAAPTKPAVSRLDLEKMALEQKARARYAFKTIFLKGDASGIEDVGDAIDDGDEELVTEDKFDEIREEWSRMRAKRDEPVFAKGDIVLKRDLKTSRTVLHRFAARKREDVVDRLREMIIPRLERAGCLVNELNRPDNLGLTPLYIAARACRLDIVSLMVEKGAKASVECGKYGWTPLDIAATEIDASLGIPEKGGRRIPRLVIDPLVILLANRMILEASLSEAMALVKTKFASRCLEYASRAVTP